MEITKPNLIPELLREQFKDQKIKVTFTQWESDDLEDDETVTQFVGTLLETAIHDNQFSGLDGAFHFSVEGEEDVIEILMDFPPDDEDVIATLDQEMIHIYGNESELLIQKKEGQH
ncbi:MAG TPA: hypothetical protein VJ824_06180 [Bacillota bacterium]|nr:hypothetical protein [Bacillota bacterium]